MQAPRPTLQHPAPAGQQELDVQMAYVAGLGFKNSVPRLQQIRVGDEVRLEREPANPHDRNAIRVMRGDRQVGYVRAAKATELAPMLDAGRPRQAVVFSTSPAARAHDWTLQIRIAIGTAAKGGA